MRPTKLTLADLWCPVALLLGVLSRLTTEPGFGSVAAVVLIAGVAVGAGEALKRVVDASHEDVSIEQTAAVWAPSALAGTALMFYVADGGIPSDAGLFVLGLSILATALGRRAVAMTPAVAAPTEAEAVSSELELPAEVRRIA